jgi:iron complex outermembrane recepter protein
MKCGGAVLLCVGAFLPTAAGAQNESAPASAQGSDAALGQPAQRFADGIEVSASFRAATDGPVSYAELGRTELAANSFGQEPSFLFAERTPGVTFTSDSGGYLGYAYLRLRGIDQTRINMTLDGVPLNEPEDQGVYFSNHPDFLEFVESVQIQRGVGISANGVASYAGSVLFESPAPGARHRSSLSLAMGSFGTRRLSGEIGTRTRTGLGLFLRASHLTSDGYKYHSGNTSSSAFWSLGWTTGRSGLRFTGFFGQQRNQLAWLGVPLDAIERDPRTNGDTSENDRFRQSLMALRYSRAVSQRLVLGLCVYANFLAGHYDFDLANYLGLPPDGALYRYSFLSHFLGTFATADYETARIELHGGLHAYNYARRHLGSERALGELYRNTGFRDEVSGFGKLGLKTGRALFFSDVQARSTGFSYEGAVAMAPMSWSFVNPRVGVSYRLSDRLTGYLSVGRTGREPTRNDLFAGADDLALDAAGAPLPRAIPPERVVDFELGVRAAGRHWHVNANGFLMRFKDEIVLNGQFGPNGLALHSNVAASRRQGIELDAGCALPLGFTLANRSAFGQNRIREAAVGIEPVLSPAVIVNQELRVGRRRLFIGLTGRYQSGSWIDFANTTRLPAYFVLGGVVSGRSGPWALSLRVQNLTDRRYFTNGALSASGAPLYFVQASRNMIVDLRWSH